MRVRSTVVFALVFLGLTIVPQYSAQEAQKAPLVPGGLIGPDDSVTIVALGADEISKAWRVNSAGDLNLPLVGKVHAAGMTADELEQELTTKLKRFVLDPEVTVYISEFRSQRVTVTGAVERPGMIQTEGPKTLLGVLSMAGGPKSPGPTVTITRQKKYGSIMLPGAKTDLQDLYSTVELPINDVLDPRTPAANLILQPDDVVAVSTQQRLVYIMGEVNRPGAVELVTRESVSVVQVLAAAGGMTKTAAPGKTSIMRQSGIGLYDRAGSIDIKKILAGKSEDRMLKAGDIIIVPSSSFKFYFQAAALAATSSSMYTILTRF